jgi:tryptophanyl-tRNA synthetase
LPAYPRAHLRLRRSTRPPGSPQSQYLVRCGSEVGVADYQTITDRDSPASLPEDVDELVADYLAVGIDPTRATIFAHSLEPELIQLLLPFLSLVTPPELLRNPTVKDEASAGMTALNGLMLT